MLEEMDLRLVAFNESDAMVSSSKRRYLSCLLTPRVRTGLSNPVHQMHPSAGQQCLLPSPHLPLGSIAPAPAPSHTPYLPPQGHPPLSTLLLTRILLYLLFHRSSTYILWYTFPYLIVLYLFYLCLSRRLSSTIHVLVYVIIGRDDKR
jgi:hypothetical protein